VFAAEIWTNEMFSAREVAYSSKMAAQNQVLEEQEILPKVTQTLDRVPYTITKMWNSKKQF